jgi:hypothetical protein
MHIHKYILHHMQDFIVVCGKEFDVRTVTPARALNRFTRAFEEFLPSTLKGIDKASLTQQLTLLSNFGMYFVYVRVCDVDEAQPTLQVFVQIWNFFFIFACLAVYIHTCMYTYT